MTQGADGNSLGVAGLLWPREQSPSGLHPAAEPETRADALEVPRQVLWPGTRLAPGMVDAGAGRVPRLGTWRPTARGEPRIRDVVSRMIGERGACSSSSRTPAT